MFQKDGARVSLQCLRGLPVFVPILIYVGTEMLWRSEWGENVLLEPHN